MDITIIDGGVTAPKGFKAAGARAGIRQGKTNKDMAMIYSERKAAVAGTFTRNVVKAAPVLWDMQVCREGTAQAVVVNSGIANACTGDEGYENVVETAGLVEKYLGVEKNHVLVASTGVIGFTLPMDAISKGVGMLKDMLKDTRQSATDAAEAIMTTDTHKKEYAVKISIDGVEVTIGAMCKGSGMIHPNMGTMLGFITTDADIDNKLLGKALKEIIEDTFNMVSVDGDTSTNDTVVVMANGMAGNKKICDESDEGYQLFREALLNVNTHLAKEIASDGEGATRLFEVKVQGASDKSTARLVAKSIVTSNLTKCAIYGKDANWGRILCAMGYSGASFDPYRVDITISSEKGKLKLVENGKATDFDEELATLILSPGVVTAIADMKSGDGEATAWGCDLTYDYVKINADYRS